MQFFMSRYGGHGLTIGKGKSSDSELPEDQSLDYMLDHYAQEIIPNYFVISSYDAKPEWMGGMEWKDFQNKPVKLGSLTHSFNEIVLQYDITVTTHIYLTYHQYSNVFSIIIKTPQADLKDIVHEYESCYDYVLTVFIRGNEGNLKKRPKDIERILLILFYKMGLVYEETIDFFTPSKTHIGKLISEEFCKDLSTALVNVDTDEKLIDLLNQYPEYYES